MKIELGKTRRVCLEPKFASQGFLPGLEWQCVHSKPANHDEARQEGSPRAAQGREKRRRTDQVDA